MRSIRTFLQAALVPLLACAGASHSSSTLDIRDDTAARWEASRVTDLGKSRLEDADLPLLEDFGIAVDIELGPDFNSRMESGSASKPPILRDRSISVQLTNRSTERLYFLGFTGSPLGHVVVADDGVAWHSSGADGGDQSQCLTGCRWIGLEVGRSANFLGWVRKAPGLARVGILMKRESPTGDGPTEGDHRQLWTTAFARMGGR